jgi:AcrR family transcriptional regulator
MARKATDDEDRRASGREGYSGSRTRARASQTSPAGLATLRSVARRAFAARGYHAVSIRDIAQEAGLSLSVLYYYYASKQELLFGVLNEAIDGFHQILTRHSTDGEPSADPLPRFLVLINSMIEYRTVQYLDSLLFIREFRNLEPEFAEQIADRRAHVRDLFSDVIADGVESGVFRTPYPDDARRAIVAMLNAIAVWYRQPGELTIEALTARYTHIALQIVEYSGDLDALDKPAKRRKKRP